MPDSPTRRVARAMYDGMRRRCPNCHRGQMYRSFYAMNDSCGQCGHRFEPGPGEFTGAMMFTQGGLGVVAVIGFLAMAGRVPDWVLYSWLAVVLVGLPLVAYPNIKGAWLGFLMAARGPGRRRERVAGG